MSKVFNYIQLIKDYNKILDAGYKAVGGAVAAKDAVADTAQKGAEKVQQTAHDAKQSFGKKVEEAGKDIQS